MENPGRNSCKAERTLFLCTGTQCSGSTIVSWCFLQRSDVDGVLDGDNDILPEISPALARPFAWYKTTISCFRTSELMAHFQDEGWQVRPILIVRDVRDVWASLTRKSYGKNGITAEDPPLRMRLRRFKQDWEWFRKQNRPILRFEDFLTDPEQTLRRTCGELSLAWQDAMLTWPKPRGEIADTRHGNRTFWATRGQGLRDSIGNRPQRSGPLVIPRDDLQWLQSEFLEFNAANDYPAELAHCIDGPVHRDVPRYEGTRRWKWELRRKPAQWLLHRLGVIRPPDRWRIGSAETS